MCSSDLRIARIIQERAREFAVIESMDGGKPIRESRDVDVPLAAAHFFYYAGWADKLEYAAPGRNVHPLGVAGQIIPWNFPLLMAAWKIAPALAAGNTVVLKPAETTPLTALKLAEAIRDAGLPDGVVNIVTGAGTAGAAIVNHPGINKIAFTGSTEVGKIIQRAIAGTSKKYTLELGGKAANIIFSFSTGWSTSCGPAVCCSLWMKTSCFFQTAILDCQKQTGQCMTPLI